MAVMQPYRFTGAESVQLTLLLNSLSRLGQKGFERIEIVPRGYHYFLPTLQREPNWFGRLVEVIFGKSEFLQRDRVANSINSFLQANRPLIERSNKACVYCALKSIGHRFYNHEAICFTIEQILANLRSEEQASSADLEQMRTRQQELLQEAESREIRRNRMPRLVAKLKAVCKEIFEQEMTKIRNEAQLIINRAWGAVQEYRAGKVKEAENKVAAERKEYQDGITAEYSFQTLLHDPSKADLEIRCKGGEIVRAHSFVFAGIPSFQNPKKLKPCQLFAHDFSKEAMECFVKFHSGIGSFMEISIPVLAELAEIAYLMVHVDKVPAISCARLLEQCEENLFNKLDAETAWLCVSSRNPKIAEHALGLISVDIHTYHQDPRVLDLPIEKFGMLIITGSLNLNEEFLSKLATAWANRRAKTEEDREKLLHQNIPKFKLSLNELVRRMSKDMSLKEHRDAISEILLHEVP